MTTDSPAPAKKADATPEPQYQNARGCLIMLGIGILVLAAMAALMYFFGNQPAPPPTP